MKKKIKIAYIGGGSKQWARVFMSDLALTDDLEGEMALYDIDIEAAKRNQNIAKYINKNPKTNSVFTYNVYEKIDDALNNADFVLISILPGTFKEMRSDVHAPEKYGIYQSVGDTVGPGGVLRAMRTIPMFELFANKIKEICPNAWVINFTNPMSICVKALYDIFPEIKAFGCCHEVFHAQQFLTRVLKEMTGIDVDRKKIKTYACGINHFTWINKAYFKDINILSLIKPFKEKFYEDGYYEYDGKRFEFLTNPFAGGNNVKMDLYSKYKVLAAAGDRHLVEFLPQSWYLKDKETVKKYHFNLTTVDFREKDQLEKIKESILIAEGKKEYNLSPSGEEAVQLMKAIMGFGGLISNVNLPNNGQMSQLPHGSVVETDCIFSTNEIKPIKAIELPEEVIQLIKVNNDNIELTYKGIKERNLDLCFKAFINQPLCENLSLKDAKELFKEMCYNTKEYLKDHFDLEEYFKN